MAEPQKAEPNTALEARAALFRRALLLDLQMSQAGRILEVGAVLEDRNFLWTSKADAGECQQRLAGLAAEAELILGHNLRRYDLPRLRAWILRGSFRRTAIVPRAGAGLAERSWGGLRTAFLGSSDLSRSGEVDSPLAVDTVPIGGVSVPSANP